MTQKRTACAVALATALLISASVQADANDHDLARAALEAGEILPITEILTRLAAEFPGDVVEIELEQERSQWIYELKIIAPDGHLLEVEMDASDGSLIETEQHHGRYVDD